MATTNVRSRVLKVLGQMEEESFRKEYLVKDSAFSREKSQRMDFEDISMFIMANQGKTLSLEILDYFNVTGNIGNTVTKQALSKQRSNIKSQLFADLNEMYVEEVYRSRRETFNGYILLAVDGSTCEIPNTKNLRKQFGAAKASETSASNARAGLNGFYDPLNNLMVKLVVDKYQRGEKTVFLEKVQSVLDMYEGYRVIFIFDRGYICLSLLLELDELGVKYLFRVPGNCFKNEIAAADGDDSTIKIKITKQRLKGVDTDKQKAYLQMGYQEGRLLKIPLDTGETELLFTNLDDSEAAYECFKSLYFERWDIEKAFNLLKNRLHIENISSRTKNGVEQEIQATVFLGNIVEDMTREANEKITRKDQNKYEYRVNVNILAGVLKTYFLYFFSTKVVNASRKKKYYDEMLKFIQRNILAHKTGFSNPRIKRVSRNKHKTNIRRNV
jgi:IS4 transposase